MANLDIVQGYRVPIAKKYGINVAIIYEKVQFWGTKGERTDGWVYKTYDDMEEETALSPKQVRLAYDKLEEMGVIETKVMKVLNVPKKHFRLCQNAKSIESAKKQILINTGKTQNKPNSSFSSVGENNNSSPADGRTGVPAMPLLEQIIGIVNPREKATTERLRVLNGRLKDYTPEEIIDSAKVFSKSQWHIDNKQMSIDNLLAPSKFGRWFALKDEAKKEAPNTPQMTPEKKEALRIETLRRRDEVRNLKNYLEKPDATK